MSKGGRNGEKNKRRRSGNARESALVNEPKSFRPGLVQLAHHDVIALRWSCSAIDLRVISRTIAVRVSYSAIRPHIYKVDHAWKLEARTGSLLLSRCGSFEGGVVRKGGDEEAHSRGIWLMQVFNEKEVPPNPLDGPRGWPMYHGFNGSNMGHLLIGTAKCHSLMV